MISHADSSVSINAYHHNNTLLFQFILTEFINVFNSIQELNTLCQKHPISSSCGSIDEGTQKQLELVFEALMGSNQDPPRLIAWHCHGGSLTKLKLYCSLFIKNSDEDQKEMVAMQHYVDKVSQSCQKGVDYLKEEVLQFHQLIISIEKATTSIQRFTKPVIRLIHHFSSNENVLFFILRHQEAFDKIYGRGFVLKQLCRLFPRGLREVQRILSAKYSLRGFDNILPLISVKISDNETASL